MAVKFIKLHTTSENCFYVNADTIRIMDTDGECTRVYESIPGPPTRVLETPEEIIALIDDVPKIEEKQAREHLESLGYQTRNLWHIDDAREFHPNKSDEELLTLLHQALTSPSVMDEIWFSIKNAE
jgi:hypothetical protein